MLTRILMSISLIWFLAYNLLAQVDSLYWYVEGQKQYWYIKNDVWIVKLNNGLNYQLAASDTAVVDTLLYDAGRKQNEIVFKQNISTAQKDNFKSSLRIHPKFQCEYPAITSEYNDALATPRPVSKKWSATDNLVLVLFKQKPTESALRSFMGRNLLELVHRPFANMPPQGNYTYIFRMRSAVCINESGPEMAAKLIENESMVLEAAPNIDMQGEQAGALRVAAPLAPAANCDISNDPYSDQQWHIQNSGQCLGMNPKGNGTRGADCKIKPVWDAGFLGYSTQLQRPIRVAVIDFNGFELNHPDLAGQFINPFNAVHYINNNGNAGYVITDSYDVTPTNSTDAHGQACAGLIAAIKDNGIGTVGVAPEAQIIPIVVDGNQMATLAIAYQWLLPSGADIASQSLRYFKNEWFSSNGIIRNEFFNYINYGRQISSNKFLGGIFVSGAGNEDIQISGQNFKVYPAKLDEVIGVIASDPSDNKKESNSTLWNTPNNFWGSNYGEFYDIAAPGTHVVTTDFLNSGTGYNNRNNGCNNTLFSVEYNYFSGTSASVPITAGICALLLSANYNKTATEIQQILKITADKVGISYNIFSNINYYYDPTNPGKSLEMGYGRVNAYKALKEVLGYTPQSSTQHCIDDLRIRASNSSFSILKITPNDTIYSNQTVSINYVIATHDSPIYYYNVNNISITADSSKYSIDFCVGNQTMPNFINDTISINNLVNGINNIKLKSLYNYMQTTCTPFPTKNDSISINIVVVQPTASKVAITSVSPGTNVTEGAAVKINYEYNTPYANCWVRSTDSTMLNDTVIYTLHVGYANGPWPCKRSNTINMGVLPVGNYPVKIRTELSQYDSTSMAYTAQPQHNDSTFTTISVVTGITNQTKAKSISIYPNPATGEIRISGMTAKPANIRINDVLGREEKFVQKTDAKQSVSIDVSKLAQGVYTVEIEQGGQITAREKLVIQ